MTSFDCRRLFRLLRRVRRRRIFDRSEGDSQISDVDDLERLDDAVRCRVVPSVVDVNFSDENVTTSNDVGVTVNDGVRCGSIVANSALLEGRTGK